MYPSQTYPTPDSPTTPVAVCRELVVYSHYYDVLANLIGTLCSPNGWHKQGDITPEVAAQHFKEAMDKWVFAGCRVVGEIKAFACVALPDYVLECNGAAYQRVDFPDLYAALHANLIIDADNFRVPDLNGRFPLGGTGIGTQGGAADHTLTIAEMPVHDHIYQPGATLPSVVLGELPGFEFGEIPPAATSAEGGGGAHNNMPPYEVVIFGIVAIAP